MRCAGCRSTGGRGLHVTSEVVEEVVDEVGIWKTFDFRDVNFSPGISETAACAWKLWSPGCGKVSGNTR